METTDQVAAELRELRREVAELTRRFRHKGGRQLDRVGDRIEERSQDVLHHSRSLADDLERRLERVEKSVSQTVREHPKAVIGGGALGVALVGLLLALLFRRDH